MAKTLFERMSEIARQNARSTIVDGLAQAARAAMPADQAKQFEGELARQTGIKATAAPAELPPITIDRPRRRVAKRTKKARKDLEQGQLL